MTGSKAALHVVLFAGVLGVSVAGAASLGWMKGEAASFFTDLDWTLVSEALTVTLDTADDGESRDWANDKSGARGRMTVLGTEARDDLTCRRLRIEVAAKGASSSHQYRFCRRPGGEWELPLSAP